MTTGLTSYKNRRCGIFSSVRSSFSWTPKSLVHHVSNYNQHVFIELTRIVWRSGMSLDYTSYSPLTSGWTKILTSIQDHKGRQVCLMKDAPKDWVHKRETPYLLCEGLVMLDINNRPIKDYPGAPLALSNMPQPWLLEGLHRSLGMTTSEYVRANPFSNHILIKSLKHESQNAPCARYTVRPLSCAEQFKFYQSKKTLEDEDENVWMVQEGA